MRLHSVGRVQFENNLNILNETFNLYSRVEYNIELVRYDVTIYN